MKFCKETDFQEELMIGKVSSDWDIVKLEEVLWLLRNGLTTTQNKEGNGYPVTRIETISEECIDPNKVGYIHNLSESEIDEYKLRDGDILFSHINSLGHIGKTAIYEGKPELIIQGMNLLLLRPDKEKIHPIFLLHLLRFYRMKNIFRAMAKKAVNQASINQTELGRIKILLPPLDEQRAIAGVLGVVDSVIAKTGEVIAKTERLKKGLMQTLLTRGIGHKEYKQTPIGTTPKTWQIVRLGEVLELCQYGLSARFGERGKYRILKMDDIVDGVAIPDNAKYIDLDERTFENFKLEKGDILFNRTNSYELVGRTGIFLLDGDYTFASYLIRLRPKKEIVDSLFLTYYMIFSNNRLRQLATRAVHQANINATNLQSFTIPIPPLPEQKQIAETLMTVDKKLEFERKEKAKLESIKRGLMDLLLTGKIRVKVD
jgi:type I restriction enzyme S subunit